MTISQPTSSDMHSTPTVHKLGKLGVKALPPWVFYRGQLLYTSAPLIHPT